MSALEGGRRAGRRLRSALGGMLPERARYLIWERAVPRLGLARALGHRLPEPIDASRLALIDRWPESMLTDRERLERGLAELGINGEIAHVLPEELRGHTGQGLRCTQFPNQFASYLACLSRLSISSYMEIGVDHGGTFLVTTAYLNRFRPLERATAVDRFEIPTLREHPGPARTTEVLRLESRSRRFAAYLAESEPFDLVLIDGDHSERGCRRDFELVRPHARAIALHDIVGDNTPGVRAVWESIRRDHADEYELHEFTQQYPEIERATGREFLGIGLAVSRASAQGR